MKTTSKQFMKSLPYHMIYFWGPMYLPPNVELTKKVSNFQLVTQFVMLTQFCNSSQVLHIPSGKEAIFSINLIE